MAQSFKSPDTTISPALSVVTTPTRHSEYYFEDGNLIIQVENSLFNVFRSTFTRHSNVFRDVFSLPEPVGQVVEGSSDSFPIRFLGISCLDFERLLWILYPPSFGTYRPHTAEEWTSILHLATRWEFDDIRALAIREIERCPLTPVEKIALSREFDISSLWSLNAYTELCERPEALTVQEALALGLQTTVRISQLRERLRKSLGKHRASPQLPVQRTTKRPEHSFENARLGRPKEFVLDSSARSRTLHSRAILEKTLRFSEASRLVAETFGLGGINDSVV